MSRLTELTATIQAETAKIEQFLAASGLPGLSFDARAPLDFPVPASNTEMQRARRAVINATQELHDLMVGPTESVRWLAWSYNDNLSLHAVYHFRLAQAVPADGDISLDALARAAGVDVVNVKRIVRHAITNRIFCEPRPGHVAHTAASRVLVDDPTMNDWVGLCSSDFFPAAARTVDAMEKWPGSQEPTQCGFSAAWGIEVPMFVEIGRDPARAKRFGRAMQSLTGGEGYEVDYLVNGYPWEALGSATVVDVGGSHGFVPVALAKRFPDLRFVVQDLPKTVADGPAHIPPELAARIDFQAHDFFTAQPVHGADVYFFRWIFHNWSDKYCEKMLRCLIPALKPGARILVNENILPQPGSENPWDEKIIRTMDMTMLQLLNARERAEDDYAELFHRTDPRFKFLGVKRPEGSRTCTIEAVWLPDLDTTQPVAENVANGATNAVHGEKRDFEAFHSPATAEHNGAPDGTKENPAVIAADTPMETTFSNDVPMAGTAGSQNGDKLDAGTSAPIVGTEHAVAVDALAKEGDSAAVPQSSTVSTAGLAADVPDATAGASKDA
ncbi:putative o-methyltransferase family 2 protein [Neofusicoccum parvum]|uniref:O-methyltransferase family 2 protein n=1 Tax=Neofusicoccum parvum TaxID=310453 RepID=A0ACB5SCI9_9PEZI|nr:putative o-methyltransferase family 2 protein [Neofusicoccum parvum]